MKTPEFPLENLSKKELQQLVKELLDILLVAPSRAKQIAFSIREKTLWDDYLAKSNKAMHARDCVKTPRSKKHSTFYKDLAETSRCGEQAGRAFEKYIAFTKQRRNSSCAP